MSPLQCRVFFGKQRRLLGAPQRWAVRAGERHGWWRRRFCALAHVVSHGKVREKVLACAAEKTSERRFAITNLTNPPSRKR